MQYRKDGNHVDDSHQNTYVSPDPYHHNGHEATDEDMHEHGMHGILEGLGKPSEGMASSNRKYDSMHMDSSEDIKEAPEPSTVSGVASAPSSLHRSNDLHGFPNQSPRNYAINPQAVNGSEHAYFTSDHSHFTSPYVLPLNYFKQGQPIEPGSFQYQGVHRYNSYAHGLQQEHASVSMTSQLPMAHNPHSDISERRQESYAPNHMYYFSGPSQPIRQACRDGSAGLRRPSHQQCHDQLTDDMNYGSDAHFARQQSHYSYAISQHNYHVHSHGRSYHDYPYTRHGYFIPQPPPPSAGPHASYTTGVHPHTSNQASPVINHSQRPPTTLTMPDDVSWLSEFLCFVRLHCVEVFCADSDDVASRMNSKKVLIGQVGIRCCFCAHLSHRRRARRSSTFPSSLCRIYQSITMMLRDHFIACTAMPQETKDRFKTLRSNASQGIVGSKQYWIDSAKRKGMIDTPHGIFFGTGNGLNED